ncbi:hypothetical protein ACFX13_001811 [Malus domestica]
MFHLRHILYSEGYPSWDSPGDRKLLQLTVSADVVVAQDGSGTIRRSKPLWMLRRRGLGVRVFVGGSTTFKSATVGESCLSFSQSLVFSNVKIFETKKINIKNPYFLILDFNFWAHGITFRNTAGPENHQEVALRSGADLSVFYRCKFEGYQDTLYSLHPLPTTVLQRMLRLAHR